MIRDFQQHYVNNMPNASRRLFSLLKEAGATSLNDGIELQYLGESETPRLVGVVSSGHTGTKLIILDSGDLNNCPPERQKWLLKDGSEWLSRQELIKHIHNFQRYGTI